MFYLSKDGTLYSAPSVKDALNTLYNRKCAFCDNLPIGSPAQVEHYRPKDGVNGIIHSGYYWLAYEWSNLLLACGNCNSKKSNNFPIRNTSNRVTQPDVDALGIDENANFILNNPLSLEGAILLNPEIDNPEIHLVFLPSGEIDHLTTRGYESKRHYNLNRDELFVNGRKKKKDDIEAKFLRRLDRYLTGQRSALYVIEDLVDIINEEIIFPISHNLSFSEFLKQMLLNFDSYFVIGHSPSALLLRKAYLRVINNLNNGI